MAAVRCYRHFMLGSSQHSGSKTWSEVFLKKEALGAWDGRRWPGHAQKKHESLYLYSGSDRITLPSTRQTGRRASEQAGRRAGGAERRERERVCV